MATSSNNTDSNFTRTVAKTFLEKFEASRVLTKTVDTQLLAGKFSPSSGTQVDFKRPHDYKTDRTSTGDISSVDNSDIISGKATGTVQDYFTVHLDYDEIDEALELDQLEQVLAPAATRIITDLELDLGAYMFKNCNLKYGTEGTAVDAWGDIAGAGALMNSMGVPMDSVCYVMNPYVAADLANTQSGLASGDNGLVNTAWQNAQVSQNVGGMRVMTSNALSTRTSTTAADKVGALSGNPDVTYLTHKDTMIQTLPVNGFTANAVVKAGDIVTITGRNRLSLSTRQAFIDGTGSQVVFSGVVTADVTLSGTGTGNLAVAGPAIYEANGQYNTVDSAPVSGDVVTIGGATGAVLQPNLFYHKQAFGLGSVPLKKLYSTDTIATTQDGMQIRISKYADGDANKQKVRFDLLPAYSTFNPFFAGQGFGV